MPYCPRETFKQLIDMMAGQSPPTKNLRHLGKNVSYYVIGMNLKPQFTDYSFGWAIRGTQERIYVSSDHADSDLWVLHEHLVLEQGMSRSGALDLELREVPAQQLPVYLQTRKIFFNQLMAAAETPGWMKQDPAPIGAALVYLEKRLSTASTGAASTTADQTGAAPARLPDPKTKAPAN